MLLTSRRFDADVAVCGGGPAGMCIEKGIAAGELDGRELRARPAAEGAQLNEPPKGYREAICNTEGELFVNTAATVSIRSGKAPSFM